MALEIH